MTAAALAAKLRGRDPDALTKEKLRVLLEQQSVSGETTGLEEFDKALEAGDELCSIVDSVINHLKKVIIIIRRNHLQLKMILWFRQLPIDGLNDYINGLSHRFFNCTSIVSICVMLHN